MINKEIGTVIFFVLAVAHIASIIYGFIIMIPNKKVPVGAKWIFGLLFFGIPFIGPMAFHLLSKNWDNIMGSTANNSKNNSGQKQPNPIVKKKP